MYQSLLSSFSAEVQTAKSSHFHNKINSAPDMRNLFRTFNSLICPPPPPPTTSITADDFATFFTDKTKTISCQFSPSLTQDLQPTRSTAQTPIFSFFPLTEAEVSKLLLSSHPTTCPLDQSERIVISASLNLRHETHRPAKFKSAQPAKERTQICFNKRTFLHQPQIICFIVC